MPHFVSALLTFLGQFGLISLVFLWLYITIYDLLYFRDYLDEHDLVAKVKAFLRTVTNIISEVAFLGLLIYWFYNSL